jgi:hypothetical protein
MGWTTEELGFDSQQGQGFSPLHSVQPALGSTHALIQRVPVALFRGVKGLGREVDRLHPFTAEVKTGGAMAPLPDMSSLSTRTTSPFLLIWSFANRCVLFHVSLLLDVSTKYKRSHCIEVMPVRL